MTTFLLPLLASAHALGAAVPPAMPQAPPAAPAGAAAPQETDSRIDLTPDDAAETWALTVMPLPPRDGQPGSHAFVFVGILKGCTTPRTFPIVFVIDGDRKLSKQGALLSRQPDGGGCVDALATVFPEGAADGLAAATRATVTLPQATFELTARHLEYLRRRLALREPAPAGGDTATLRPALAAAADRSGRAGRGPGGDGLNERAIGLIRQVA